MIKYVVILFTLEHVLFENKNEKKLRETACKRAVLIKWNRKASKIILPFTESVVHFGEQRGCGSRKFVMWYEF